jgi:hypothetical protein
MALAFKPASLAPALRPGRADHRPHHVEMLTAGAAGVEATATVEVRLDNVDNAISREATSTGRMFV